MKSTNLKVFNLHLDANFHFWTFVFYQTYLAYLDDFDI